MTEPQSPANAPATPKGVATRQRIVDAASDLVFERGTGAVSLDEVLAASGTSKSQLYHYFADRSDLIHAVLVRQGERVLDFQRDALNDVDGWEALRGWKDQVVALVESLGCRGGCPVGSIANELAEVDEPARAEAAWLFDRWQDLLRGALRAMVDVGQLRRDADIDHLALIGLAAIQGGLLLAKTTRTTAPLEASLDGFIGYLRTYARARARAV